PEPFRPAAVISGSVELLALRAGEAGVVLAVEAPDDLPDIIADRRAVMQILINLVANAVRFSDRGGTVTVRAGMEREHLVFEVADAGIGMAPDELARIGTPYFRGAGGRRHDGARAAVGLDAGPTASGMAGGVAGAGLGLSIVKGLVELHGGMLE